MDKSLSSRGRLQLVRSIIRVVLSVCEKFLWSGKTLDSKKAPIAWSNFYNPRVPGGWNLISMEIRNKVVVLKLLWALAFKADKLWV